MSVNEKFLLKILIIVTVCAGFYIPVYLNISSIKESKTSAAKYSKSVADLKKHIEDKKKEPVKITVPEDKLLSLSEATDLILKKMLVHNIIPERYQLHESKNNCYVDFSISCSVQDYFSYVTDDRENTYPYTLISSSIKFENGMIKASIRFNNEPCRYCNSDVLLYKNELVCHFPKKVLEKTTLTGIEKNEVEEPEIRDGNSLYKSLGYITEGGDKYLFIKTIETGKIIKIKSSDVTISEDYLIVKIENVSYKLSIY